ncbi:acriflavine resistance protein B [Hahella sp. CCB-MM4]|uniref:efflux RND transporter permease subunit n=1 Tax=Hahella sp. (strain CCB-MM4) TaxID=1926491 RepID=UPI000B9B81CF|nr:efflux RND transporter permease subunit [Hahella sp. CCB-MM4]OZG75424.1 acriflavine resistance protein B [Hahella sp. CCB-MM4]
MQNYDRGIIQWFATNPVAANLLLITTIVLGLLSLSDLRKEAFPSMEPDSITVSVSYDGGDAKQAEEGIALKVEEALETVSGIKRITSTSNSNGSTISIEKTSDWDLDDLLNDVKTQVDAVNNFPTDADKPVIEKARRQDHAIWVHLYGDTDRSTLQTLADRLKADLLAKSAISDLSVSGKADPLMSIEIDEARLQAYGLTISDIAGVINNESSSALTTSLRNSNKTVRLKASEQASSTREFADIPLMTTEDGAVIRLGDIASVTDGFEDDTFVLSRYNQQNAIGIQILMDEQGDVTNIVEQAQQVVDNWKTSGSLPANVSLETWYDKSTLIKDRLSLLTKNALTGIAMVFIVLALFLNLRVAFWVAAGLPFVFFGTLYFMTDNFTGLTINEMTTFGFIMALGIVVDDAVVVGESVYATRKAEGDTLNNTVKGTMKVAVPTIFGVLTTVAAFMSLSNVSGNLGKIYAQFATIVTICLLLSVVESKLILPAHLAHLNTHRGTPGRGVKHWWSHVQHAADSGLQWFNHQCYRPLIKQTLRFRYAVVPLFLALAILVVGLPLSGSVRISFFPGISGDVVTARIAMEPDASFGQTDKALLQLEQQALLTDQTLQRKSGEDVSEAAQSAIKSLQVVAESDLSGTVRVELEDNAPYSIADFGRQWEQLSGKPEGVRKLKIMSTMAMVDNLRVELKAWNEDSVIAAGKQLRSALEQVSGVSGIDDNLSSGQPQYRFQLTEQGRALGLDTATLSRQLLQAFGGESVQRFQRDKDEVTVRVRYPETQRQTYADIEQASIRTSSGQVVPLSSVATVIQEYQQKEITRIDGLRAVTISASVDKDRVSSNELVGQLQTDLVPQLLRQYPDLSIHFGGEAEQQAETTSSMTSMFVITLLVIYALLAIPLKSYIQPVMIMTAIPFGIVGAILGHWLNDLTISILSLNGVLALSGVVVNDSLLLVSSFNNLVRKREIEEESFDIQDLIINACTGRLRAVLLTSFTTFAGLAPLLGETSMQAQFLIPAAASLGYGILFATLITLILIPVLLMIREDMSRVTQRLFAKRKATQEEMISPC